MRFDLSELRTGVSVVLLGSLCVGSMAIAQESAPPPKPTQEKPTQEKTSEPVESTPTGVEPDASAPRMLDEILVTATRTPREAFDLPFSSAIIDAKTFRERSYRTTPEALGDIPGVMVQKTSNGQGSPFIRGFTGFRNVFLIDGIRLNNSVFRDGPNQYWNTVDPYSLSRIELIKGPSSVLYSSDAIGGTVSASTLSPYSYGAGVNVAGRTFYRFSSGERSSVARGEISFSVDERFGLLLGVTGKNYGDIRAGNPTGVQPNTGYGEADFDMKAEYFLTPTAKLVLAHQRVRQSNVPRTHKTVFSKSFKGTTIGKDRKRDLDQERELTYLQLHATEMDGWVDEMHLSLSWQLQKETRDRIKGSGSRDLQGFDVSTIGMSAQFQSQTPIGRLTYGGEFYHDSVNSFSSKNPIQGPVADNATYDLVGVFIQNEIEVTDRLSAVLGERYSYARANAKSVRNPQGGGAITITDSWSSLVGSARLLYEAAPDRLNLFAGVSQGFRAPNLSDLTRFDSARSNEVETAAPGLSPEHFLSYELGAKARGEIWSATASLFYTDVNSMIIRTPTGAVIDGENEITKRNAGNGSVMGVELSARVQPHPNWTLAGQLTLIDGGVDTFPTATSGLVREPIDRLMPATGLVSLRYTDPEGRFWVEGAATLAARADRLSTRDRADTDRIPIGGTPGYEVVSIRSGFRLSSYADLTLAIENLTGQDYRIHGSGQNEPGRSFVMSVEFRF